MNSITRSLGRPSDLQDYIVQSLRGLIVDGELAPGSRLPTRMKIQEQYGASTNTVQRALERLKQDGFVTADGRNGTFVSEIPPHLTRYGLIVPNKQEATSGVLFWKALVKEAESLERANELTIPTFYGLDKNRDGPEIQDFWRQVNGHLLAGLIISAPFIELLDTPLWREPGIPRVVIGPTGIIPDVPSIQLDYTTFRAKAMEFLKQRNRRKPALVWLKPYIEWLQNEEGFWSDEGFDVRPHWWQIAESSNRLSVRRLVHLLMESRERPDALVVMDDNLVEGAVQGLVDAGVRVPEDVEVITHCNFPWPIPTVLPTKQLGYDCHSVMQTCIELIDAQRQGKDVPSKVLLPAFFEEELPVKKSKLRHNKRILV